MIFDASCAAHESSDETRVAGSKAQGVLAGTILPNLETFGGAWRVPVNWLNLSHGLTASIFLSKGWPAMRCRI